MDLMQGEQMIWSGHPTWKRALGCYVRAVAVVLTPTLIVSVPRALDLGSSISLSKWWLITIALLVGVGAIDGVRRAATVDAITTQQLNIRRGMLPCAGMSQAY